MRETSVRRILGACLTGMAVAVLPLLTGCHRTYSEMLIRSNIAATEAPAWVSGDPQEGMAPADVAFIGRSVAVNVLDEPSAVAAAREDVYRQIASLISTRVTTRSYNADARLNTETGFVQQRPDPLWGSNHPWPKDPDYDGYLRFLAGPEVQQQIQRQAWLFSSCVAGDLVDRGAYFEQWDLREVHKGLAEREKTAQYQRAGVYGRAKGMVRYKCWVRMTIPRERLDARIGEFRQFVRDAYDRFVQDRTRMISWADRERQLRFEREEDARKWAREDQREDRAEARELRRIMGVDRVRFQVADQ